MWGKRKHERTGRSVVKTEAQWKQQLTHEQYSVLRQGGTERPGSGASSSSSARYHCAACGEALFDAADKYDSGTGWPSFTQPIGEQAVEHVRDVGLLGFRTEVRCRSCASHLGHVFPDGPRPTGQRYCMNAVALSQEPDLR